MNTRFLIFTIPILLAGCANLSTVSRRTDIPNAGVAIHLDAAQRVVYASTKGLCAEPTPDALQSLAASTGAGLSASGQGSASLANAFQANAASIGLHTQSITLMRDQLYRICEAGYNEKLGALDVTQLLQRAQDFTLGILAIEQLTGVVTSRQVVLSGQANASAVSNIGATQAQLDKAIANEAAKKSAASTADAAASAAETTAKKSSDAVKAANAATPAPTADALKTLTDQQTSDQVAANKADAAAKSADSDYKTAQTSTQVVRDNLDTANASGRAAASGSGTLASDGTSHDNIDKDTVAAIAQATTQIVETLVNRGYITDTCLNLMAATANGKGPAGDLTNVMDLCKYAIKAATDIAVSKGHIPFLAQVNFSDETLAAIASMTAKSNASVNPMPQARAGQSVAPVGKPHSGTAEPRPNSPKDPNKEFFPN